MHPSIRYRLFDFEDPLITPATWNQLLQKSSSNVIFMTWQWQKAWWDIFGRGQLLLISAEEDGQPIFIAPLFADGGMIFFTGSGGSDYLDFIGDTDNPAILENILLLAAEQVTDFVGFRFYHILEHAPTAMMLEAISKKQGWEYYDEGSLPAPMLEMEKFPEIAHSAAMKKSLLRHEAWFEKNGGVQSIHLHRCKDILPWLDEFFEQHTRRWQQTAFPGLFNDKKQRLFYKRFVELASATGWLRFAVIKWKEKAIAFHYGFNYNGSFLWYKPSFDIELAKHSPGEVLLRQLLLQALKEHAQVFDLGLGDEIFKERFATSKRFVHTHGLYPLSPNNETT